MEKYIPDKDRTGNCFIFENQFKWPQEE